jgi:NAD(P)-dependent dehydrogenase (short-subunit alcohol dehydrogenase family)
MTGLLDRLFSLSGRTALVTGGSRGIGRMIAEGFLAAGAKVYISARKAEQCDAVAAELSASHGRCVSLPQDVSTVEGCEALAARFAEAEPGGLDILVNNAGASWLAPFGEFPERGWDKVLDLNLKSPFFLTQALLPSLEKRVSADRPAKVINIASMDAYILNDLEAYSYAASKAGLVHLTRRLAAQLVRRRIVVSGIAPGPFASDLNVHARDDAGHVAARTPAQRIGAPEDMAGAAIYLASRAGDYVVGDTLIVDGGIAFASLTEASS